MFLRYPNKKDDACKIEQSLLLNSGNSELLYRTGNGDSSGAWTWSCWIKPSVNNKNNSLFGKNWSAANNYGHCTIQPDGTLYLYEDVNGPNAFEFKSKFKLRDPSAWTHFVIKKIGNAQSDFYVNGTLVESYTPYNRATSKMFDNAHTVGARRYAGAYSYEYDGYLSDVHLIYGQALGPEHFALTDENGVYNPIPYTGTYGKNGFYLPFEASDIGADHSGNGNDFATVRLKSDSVVADTPCNNYCTFNPLDPEFSGKLTNGNLTKPYVAGHMGGSTFDGFVRHKYGIPDGLGDGWYFEENGVGNTTSDPAYLGAAAGTFNFGQKSWNRAGGPFEGTVGICTKNFRHARGR